MGIQPDTKDWTWVLERGCPDCRFDSRSFPRQALGAMLRRAAQDWERVLLRRDVRNRPNDGEWAPLEYACHVRDAFRLYEARVQLTLTRSNPVYPEWDQDKAAVFDRYRDQDPVTVAAELTLAAERLAARFDRVSGAQWKRTGQRVDGTEFSVETLGRFLAHDWHHHLWDVTRASAAADR